MLNLLFTRVIILCCVLLLGGCASSLKMGLSKDQKNIDLSTDSIAIFSVKLTNQYSTMCLPHLSDIYYVDATPGNTIQRVETDSSFKDTDNSREYLMSFKLKPGTYKFLYMTGWDWRPVLGDFQVPFPLLTKSEIPNNSVTYLGHIDVIIRDKADDKEWDTPGALINLLYLACLKGSTVDVVVKDQYANDVQSFLATYPFLDKEKITKSIFPEPKKPRNYYNLNDPTIVP